jgi:hypothetical protein
MDTGAWVGLLVTAVALLAAIATLVTRIREHRAEQARLRAIDELHRARDREAVPRERERHARERETQGAPHTPQ